MRSAILFLSLLCFPAAGVEILKLGPSHELFLLAQDPLHTWKANERACLSPRAGEAEPCCATVIVTAKAGVLVAFASAQKDLKVGDQLEREVPKEERPEIRDHVAGALRDEEERRHYDEMIAFYAQLGGGSDPMETSRTDAPVEEESVLTGYDVTAGVSVSSPMLTFQLAAQPHWAIGLSGTYATINAAGQKSSALGGLLGVNYYSQEAFEGFWGQVAGGYFRASTPFDGVSVSQTTYGGLVSAGWRFRMKSLNFGLAAGVQGYYLVGNSPISYDTLVVSPTALLDIGWVF